MWSQVGILLSSVLIALFVHETLESQFSIIWCGSRCQLALRWVLTRSQAGCGLSARDLG
jgi:hypothetical protein